MTSRQRKIDCLALTALLLASAANAQALQSVDSIRAAAARFVTERLQHDAATTVHAEAGMLDPRLRMPACTAQLAAFSPSAEIRAAARMTIGVRCAAPAWTVYVPVTVESELKVLVTLRALPRNASVQPLDVELQLRRVPGIAAGYLTSTEQLAGRHLRATVAPGTALGVELLSPDILIRRGQRVTLVANAGGLEVRAQGEAVADAGPDGRVRVLNLASRRIVEGQAQTRDTVRVSL